MSLAPRRESQKISKRWCSGNHEFGALLVWIHGSNTLTGEALFPTAAFLILKNTKWCFFKAPTASQLENSPGKQLSLPFNITLSFSQMQILFISLCTCLSSKRINLYEFQFVKFFNFLWFCKCVKPATLVKPHCPEHNDFQLIRCQSFLNAQFRTMFSL